MPGDMARADPGSGHEKACMTIQGDSIAVRNGLCRLMSMAPLSHLSDDARGNVEIVLAEVLNNVVEHAYRDAPGPISVCIDLHAPVIEVSVCDHGAPMPDGHLPPGELRPLDAAEDLPEGGFGWYLIRALTQDLRYERAGDINRLCFALQA